MNKYKVEVTVRAAFTYEIEVEAESMGAAEDLAISLDRENTPDDFQVNQGYITDWDVDDCEQLTWECQECGLEITEDVSRKNDELCEECNAKLLAEEEASRQRRLADLKIRGIDVGRISGPSIAGKTSMLDVLLHELSTQKEVR